MVLEGKIALITGAAQGIGKEIALLFASNGADISACDVNQNQLEKLKSEIEAKGRKCLTLQTDVSNAKQVDDAVKKTLDSYSKIHILVNNAGITRDNLIIRMSEEEWDAVLSINLKGAFLFTKSISRPMMKQREGKIVNIASIIGIMGNAGQANYSASKAGIIGLTKSTAKELASRNINVNAIAPGFIQTAMTDKLTDDQKAEMLKQIPLNRLGQAGDVAKLALFLASENAEYITGEVIKVDGGMVM